MMVYLDNAATTKPSDVATLAYNEYAEKFGNASSAYRIGVANFAKIEYARNKIAKYINANPEQIFFTSGGSESNNWALHNFESYKKLVSAIEHPSVLNAVGIHTYLRNWWKIPVDTDGVVSKDFIKNSLEDDPDPYLVSVMMVNNETGIIEPIKEIAEIAHKHKSYIHTDAVQAIGHIPIDVKDLDVDMLSASGHKFGAFPGVGFIYIKDPEQIATPLIAGGHQEHQLRGGTYNVAGIVGMADALGEKIKYMEGNHKHLIDLQKKLIVLLNEIGNISYNTAFDKSVPHIVNLSIDGVRAEEVVSLLDMQDIYISSGSACTSNDNRPSHVLLAMGRTEEEANSSIRISMSEDTLDTDSEWFVHNLKQVVETLRR